jgi:aspartate ammonia-lyase
MNRGVRVEHDPLGPVDVPADAWYGAQTARAVANFPVSGLRPHPRLIDAVVRIKRAAASVHRGTGRLDAARA